jgi:hypothetical protein
VFEKDGYETMTKELTTSGKSEEILVAVLEKESRRSSGGSRRPGPGSSIVLRDPTKPKDPDPPKPPPVSNKSGTLLLNAKPPCKVYIDGRDTGQTTPLRTDLKAGRHKVTLINNEFNIRESFTVTIKADENNKVLKDMSSRIKK